MFKWKRSTILSVASTHKIYTTDEFIKYIRFWDWKAYRSNYKDLQGFTENMLLLHVLQYGIPQKRKLFIDKTNNNILSKETIIQNFNLLLPKNFNTKIYARFYDELANKTENDIKIHYILHKKITNKEINQNFFVDRLVIDENYLQNKLPLKGPQTVSKKVEPVVKQHQTVSKKVQPVVKQHQTVSKKVEPVVKQHQTVSKKVQPVVKQQQTVSKKVEPVVKKVEPVVKKVEPVVKKVELVIEELPPVIEEAPPVIEEAPPVIEEAPPVIEEAPPVIEEAPPVIEEASPVIEEASPVIEEASPVIEEASPVIEELPPVIEEAPPVIEDSIVYENKISIFHCDDITIFDSLIKKIPSILKSKLLITYCNESYRNSFTNYPNINIIELLEVSNKGSYNGPFLLGIKYLLNNDHLYDNDTLFYKFHTNDADMSEVLIKDIIDCTIENNEKTILFGSNKYVYSQNKGLNIENIKSIFERNTKKSQYNNLNSYFDIYNSDFVLSSTKNKFTNLEFSKKFYKYYEPDLALLEDGKIRNHWKETGINEYHRKSNVNYIKKWAEKENYFIEGAMFGFNISFLNSFKDYNIDYEYSILEDKQIPGNKSKSKTHAWDYYFGFYVIFNNGKIYGYKDNKLQTVYKNKKKNIVATFSQINRPYFEARIAFFMVIPKKIISSNNYKSILKYIKSINDNYETVDIYFGKYSNDDELIMNVDDLNEYGIPNCKNWFDTESNQINNFVTNIATYGEIEIDKNNYYIGFKCQKHYYQIVATDLETSKAVHKNKIFASKMHYLKEDKTITSSNENYLKSFTPLDL